MTILITGVAGLIGSQFAKWLMENTSDTVIGVDDLSGGYRENVPCDSFYNADCCNAALMEHIFENHKPNIVYHFAAYAAEGLSPFIRTFNYTNNLVATANIVNCCIRHNVGRLIFTSSMAVYGQGDPPFSESDQAVPHDPYGVAKLAAEQDIQIAGEQHGLDWCILRPHNVYGPGQNIWDKYRNVLGIWMNQHLNGEKITIYGDGKQSRAFTYIKDILYPLFVAGVDESASKQIINIGSSSDITILQAAETLIEVMGGGEIQKVESRHEVKAAYATHSRARERLLYKDQTPLRLGLEQMWEWAKAQPKREVKKMNYEIENRMYKFWK